MALQLAYKEFYGRNIEQMPILIAERRIPLSVAGLMQRRLEVRNASEAIRTTWIDNYFDTGDAVAYHPNGNIKVILDSQDLRNLTPESELREGALVVPNGMYEQLEAPEFTRNELEKHVGNRLSKRNAKLNPVLVELARDKSLLNDYVDYIFSEAKQRFDYYDNMGVYIDSASNFPKLRAWCVYWLESWSNVVDLNHLDVVNVRLVGLAPEAQRAIGKESRVSKICKLK